MRSVVVAVVWAVVFTVVALGLSLIVARDIARDFSATPVVPSQPDPAVAALLNAPCIGSPPERVVLSTNDPAILRTALTEEQRVYLYEAVRAATEAYERIVFDQLAQQDGRLIYSADNAVTHRGDVLTIANRTSAGTVYVEVRADEYPELWEMHRACEELAR